VSDNRVIGSADKGLEFRASLYAAPPVDTYGVFVDAIGGVSEEGDVVCDLYLVFRSFVFGAVRV
jgi:hypothetical protein